MKVRVRRALKYPFIRYSFVRIIRLRVFFLLLLLIIIIIVVIIPPRKHKHFLTYLITRFIHLYVFFLVPFGKHINETLLY